jgi:hypothetical protein
MLPPALIFLNRKCSGIVYRRLAGLVKQGCATNDEGEDSAARHGCGTPGMSGGTPHTDEGFEEYMLPEVPHKKRRG